MAVTSPRADARQISPFIPDSWEDEKEHRRLLAEALQDAYRIYHRVQPTNVQTVTATYSMQTGDLAVLADTTTKQFTVYLPTAQGVAGKEALVKLLTAGGTNAVVIHGKGSETFDGAASLTISIQYAVRRFLSDGTNWHVIGRDLQL